MQLRRYSCERAWSASVGPPHITSILPYHDPPQPILAAALSQTESYLALSQTRSGPASPSQTGAVPLVWFRCS